MSDPTKKNDTLLDGGLEFVEPGFLALTCASRGWAVFPLYECDASGICTCPAGGECGSPGKHPRVPDALQNATADTGRVFAWWKSYPTANVGLALRASRLVVLDVDPRRGGDEFLAELEGKHGKLPYTVAGLTGSGGKHLRFVRPDLPSVPPRAP